MKTRRVMVTLELETDATIAELRDREVWVAPDGVLDASRVIFGDSTRVIQVQANVIKPGKKAKAKKR